MAKTIRSPFLGGGGRGGWGEEGGGGVTFKHDLIRLAIKAIVLFSDPLKHSLRPDSVDRA